MQKHGNPAEAPTWTRRNIVKLTISDRDLLAVAIGERVPVKLFSVGRLRIKVGLVPLFLLAVRLLIYSACRAIFTKLFYSGNFSPLLDLKSTPTLMPNRLLTIFTMPDQP